MTTHNSIVFSKTGLSESADNADEVRRSNPDLQVAMWPRQATWGGGRTDTRRGAVRSPGTRGVSSRRRAGVAPCRSESPEGGFRGCDAGPCCPDEAPADARGARRRSRQAGRLPHAEAFPSVFFLVTRVTDPDPTPCPAFIAKGAAGPGLAGAGAGGVDVQARPAGS